MKQLPLETKQLLFDDNDETTNKKIIKKNKVKKVIKNN